MGWGGWSGEEGAAVDSNVVGGASGDGGEGVAGIGGEGAYTGGVEGQGAGAVCVVGDCAEEEGFAANGGGSGCCGKFGGIGL